MYCPGSQPKYFVSILASCYLILVQLESIPWCPQLSTFIRYNYAFLSPKKFFFFSKQLMEQVESLSMEVYLQVNLIYHLDTELC